MESIMKIMVSFAGWFWGPPILILIGGGGIWCTLQLKALQLTRFPYVCSQTFGKMFSKRSITILSCGCGTCIKYRCI